MKLLDLLSGGFWLRCCWFHGWFAPWRNKKINFDYLKEILKKFLKLLEGFRYYYLIHHRYFGSSTTRNWSYYWNPLITLRWKKQRERENHALRTQTHESRWLLSIKIIVSHLIVVSLVHAVQQTAHSRPPLVQSSCNDRWVHRKCIEIKSNAWNHKKSQSKSNVVNSKLPKGGLFMFEPWFWLPPGLMPRFWRFGMSKLRLLLLLPLPPPQAFGLLPMLLFGMKFPFPPLGPPRPESLR